MINRRGYYQPAALKSNLSEKSGGPGAPANNILKSILFGGGTGMRQRQREARVSQEVQGPIRTRCRLERAPLLYRPNTRMQQPGEEMRNIPKTVQL